MARLLEESNEGRGVLYFARCSSHCRAGAFVPRTDFTADVAKLNKVAGVGRVEVRAMERSGRVATRIANEARGFKGRDGGNLDSSSAIGTAEDNKRLSVFHEYSAPALEKPENESERRGVSVY